MEFAALSAVVAEQEGWSVDVFHDGDSFLAAVNEADTPALLIIDVNLPGLGWL